MAHKVNLDALIPREDFDVQDNQGKGSGRNITTLSINDLKEDSFFFSAVRKPDFQRETNEWDTEKVCNLIESFLNGELIPAIILWRSASSFTFVIDGSHRLSALAAWINDDYGDGRISKKFYDGKIPDEQIQIAEKTRQTIKKQIGSFSDHELAVKSPDKVSPDIAERAKSLGAIAIQLQWVEGGSQTAESSFFKINQQGAPIDKTELRLLKARKKPNGVAARAIIRSGKGHKYWSEFNDDKKAKIEALAKEINEILFTPDFKSPVKTLDLPIGGKLYSSQTLPLVLDFVNIVNRDSFVNEENLLEDQDGSETINYLINCKNVARRINSNHPSSLGLHPVVYFYSQGGRHKIASFFAITAFILELEKRKLFNKFIEVRESFEQFLLVNDYIIQQIVRKYRSAMNSFIHVKDFYLDCMDLLLVGKKHTEILSLLIVREKYTYLTEALTRQEIAAGANFSSDTKSAAFIKEALENALKCKICNGYIHRNSISIDHIVRKQDGGTGTIENAQLSHPYCNTTYKN